MRARLVTIGLLAATSTALFGLATGTANATTAHTPAKPRDTTPPKPVTALKLSTDDVHSISLRWNNPSSPDLVSLLIRRSTGTTAPKTATQGTLVATRGPATTSFTDTTVQPATTYSYAIFPRDRAGNIGRAASLTATSRSTNTNTGVAGLVTDSRLRPIAGLPVQLTKNGTVVATGTTSKTGSYRITNVAPGRYTVCYAPDDTTAGKSTGYLASCHATSIGVLAGLTTPVLPDRLATAGAITGTVTTADGKPAKNVPVTATGTNGTVHQTTTASNGTYTIRNLSSQPYRICAGTACTSNVAVTAGKTTRADEHLASAAQISGHVTEPDGTPVAGVEVRASGDTFTSVTSQADGSYAISGLPVGNYSVCFDGTFDITDAAPYGYTDECTTGGTTVTVSTGSSATANGTVQRAGRLTGTVHDSNGPIFDVVAYVYDSNGTLLNSINTDDNGQFLFTGLAPGTVTVCFDPTETIGFYPETCYQDQPFGTTTGTPITINPGQVTTVDEDLSTDSQ